MGAVMRADLAARLRCTMRREAVAEDGVVGVAGVTATPAIRLKPQQLPQLRQIRLENGHGEKSARRGVSSPVSGPTAPDFDAIEERAALAADRVPARYLDAWARLQCQRPSFAPAGALQQAIHDGGTLSRHLGRGRSGDAVDSRRIVRCAARRYARWARLAIERRAGRSTGRSSRATHGRANNRKGMRQ